MSYRSKYLPIIVLLSGFLLISAGLNLIYISRVCSLEKMVMLSSAPVSNDDLDKMMKEIDRLSIESCPTKFDVLTKEPIKNPYLIISGGNSKQITK